MLYKIPLLMRAVCVEKDSALRHSNKSKCLHIDEVGLFVYYRDEKHLEPDFIRIHLVGVESTNCLVEAPDPEKAIEIFFNKWEGAKTGGKKEEQKALWINRKQNILELPPCKLLHKNKEGQFICGEPAESGNGEFGMCILENCDSPSDCPIDLFYSAICEGEESLLGKKISGGYSVISPSCVGL